ncbi:hypothetical protein [Solimonas soli]|uniref:hypothetical protein n=1 Tax=Solimonas soli TaxID=413479 RepID=UPI0004897EB3|nr:hypothetical protein [Solimonas soli]
MLRTLGILLVLAVAAWFAHRQRLDEALVDAVLGPQAAPAPLVALAVVLIAGLLLMFPRR